MGKRGSQLGNGLKKRWFVEGLRPTLKKKMKIVPPVSYIDAYNRAMDLESEQKTSKKKHKSSDSDNSSSEVAAAMKNQVRKLKHCRRICYG